MKPFDQKKEEYEDLCLRLELACERIRSLAGENAGPRYGAGFFYAQAAFIEKVFKVRQERMTGLYEQLPLKDLQERNRELYDELTPEGYEKSFCNPDYACSVFGPENGRVFSALAAELRNIIPYVFEDRLFELTVTLELFLLFLSACDEEKAPSEKELKSLLYSHFYDYSPEIFERRVTDLVGNQENLITDIVMNADLSGPEYLYRYGEPVSENEIRTAQFLNTLPEEEIERIAAVYTGGYRKGFEAAGKDLSKKKTVNIRFSMGFERIVRAAVRHFDRTGLAPVIYRAPSGMLFRRVHKTGFSSAGSCPQFDYDHRYDEMLILDEDLVSRKLSSLAGAFENHSQEAAEHGGPAVIETFGEKEFTPLPKESAVSADEKHMALKLKFESESARIINRYIKSEERSFTIIAFPVPEIGERFPEIFRETVKINGMDSGLYQKIQQNIIDVLDKASYVRIKGAGANRTDLTVRLHKLADPASQTNFENCTADVNIPVGEVFTSPVLKGTDGLLHVSYCYINGLKFTDLTLPVKDGMLQECTCKGPAGDENGEKLIRDNILFGHKTLPMGEFAVGTNTAAYRMGRTYGIEEKLPILIAEKTGPHFAFGDTCYSYEEEVRVYNPDGKEIIAKENECSVKRKDDPSAAYFNCHTDITLPYDELEYIRAVDENGKEWSIIENGRYAVAGTEALNIPLDEI